MTNGSQIERPKLQADEPLNSENVVPTADPTPGGRWDKLLILLRVASVRLRFIGLFAAIFLVFAYWDTMTNYYDKWTRPASGGSKAGDGFEFWCPMCPQVVRDEMGICPICNMALSKRKKTNAEPLGEGVLARITLDAGEIVLAGVRVSEVKHVDLVKTINTFGFVDVDERRLVRISARVDGWIKKLHVDFTGKKIVRGDPLVDIYSPTLNLAIEELIKQIFVHLTVAEFVNRPILAIGRVDFDRLGKHAFYIQDHDRPAKVRGIMLIARIGFEPDLRFL